MRRVVALIVFALLVPAPLPVSAADGPILRISELLPDPDVEAGQREFVEFHNTGSQDMDLAGWTVNDIGQGNYTFTSWVLPAGGRVVLWSGGGGNALGPAWSEGSKTVWNKGGDVVSLFDPDGALVDSLTYGTTDIPTPPTGVSLHWDGAWIQGEPTPGQDMQGSTGTASATVEDLPPEVTWLDFPATVRPGDNVTVRFQVTDANDDAVSWTMQVDGVQVADGTGGGPHEVTATAPDAAGTWAWTVTATSTHHQTIATLDLDVSTGAFRIVLPTEGIHFPAMAPGATDVAASAPFRILHQEGDAAVPYLDISPFQGPGGAIPVDGNLNLLLDHADGTTTQAPYDGPLHALPAIEAGGWIEVTLVILDVPAPLAAGDYRSSFTVVA